MKQFRMILGSLVLLGAIFVGGAQAQYGDPMAEMNRLMFEQEQAMWQLQQQNMQWEIQAQEHMQQLQQQADQAWMQQLQFWANYYIQNTGDNSLPFQEAARRGDILWCQHNPVQCQQNIAHTQEMTRINAAGHQQRMNDINAWGNTMRDVARTNSEISDMNHQGWLERNAIQDQSQANYIQGAVWGEATYVNGSGNGYSLPLYPDQTMTYSTPDGYQLGFDYDTSTWYQADAYGNWVQLQQQR